MSARYLHLALLAGLSTLCIGPQAAAMDCDTEVPVELGDKPAMDAYADYSDFLVAIMDYKARDRELLAQQEACPQLFVKQVDPSTLDPTVTYGPETLDSAIARASKLQGLAQPSGPVWHNRSTSKSFRLPMLGSPQMEKETISTHLRTLIDDPVSDRDQTLAINLLGPLPENDGHWGPETQENLLADALPEREREAEIASLMLDAPTSRFYTLYGQNGGYITLYFYGDELTNVYSLSQSCLCSPDPYAP